MNTGEIRSSAKINRLGVAALGLMIVAYLTAISLAYVDQLNSTKRIATFSLLWLLGIVALILLARAWRHFAHRTESR